MESGIQEHWLPLKSGTIGPHSLQHPKSAKTGFSLFTIQAGDTRTEKTTFCGMTT
jgi:hypothetical protein